MRIGLVAHTDAPWTPHYVRAFRESGHAICIVSFSPNALAGETPVFVGRRPYDPDRGKHVFLTRVPQVRKTLRSFAPDVVFAPYLISNGLSAALGWRGPLIVSARGSDVLRHAGRPIPPWFHRLLVRYIGSRSNVVHVVSEELADAVVACGVDRQKLICFPIGVDLSQFGRPPGQHMPNTPHIICTRRHEAVYSNHIIVDALARLKAQKAIFQFSFVGGGKLLDERRSQIRSLGLEDRVKCLGQVPHEQMAATLATAQIYVSASISDGTSSSLLEAMASGLFPVVTRIRANQQWVRDGKNGLLFRPGNSADLVAALIRIIDQPEWVNRVARTNRSLVEEKGNQEFNMRQLMRVMERVADETRMESH